MVQHSEGYKFVIVQGLPYSEKAQMGMSEIHGGSPYGPSSVSGVHSDRGPTPVDLELARALGRGIAITAGKLLGVRTVAGAELPSIQEPMSGSELG